MWVTLVRAEEENSDSFGVNMMVMDVLIIEDEPVWQLKIQMMIEQIIPEPCLHFADSAAEARHILSTVRIDLVVSDIVLPDGEAFDIFTPPLHKLPVIFLTDYPNDTFYSRTSALPKTVFIAKPFHELTLKSSIETLAKLAGVDFWPSNKYLPVVDKYRRQVQLILDKVVWVQSDGNYSIIQSTEQKYIIKKSLTVVAEFLDSRFIQVQQSFIVNIHFVSRVEMLADRIFIYGQTIPIGRRFRKEFLHFWEKNQIS
ncbi:LytR/AlgR family response regulator transcription factor [Runella sp.]|uniref:LytR/AlgR family response regulator transcription factor n=1 Tax=Runella sp. TaxID=1960881 RepID=UPI003D13E6B4